ncbi:MAG: hypothetical protein INQ03_19735 [Candidatus Heimdallarchaeota archaeon]|nr:hypothetical protein [Candidatus Heimdallarchaeota archaeon]
MAEFTEEEFNTSLVCEIDHPLFDIIDNVTRRQILRLIACEHNYGNRIANILDLSTPAIHRHLKYLQGNNPGELSLIIEGEKTKLSASGHKGGEAQLYKVNANIGLFFHIFPNFVHNHIVELNNDQETVVREENKDTTLRYLEPMESKVELDADELNNLLDILKNIPNRTEKQKEKDLNKIGDDKLKGIFHSIYLSVQKHNKRIRELEEEMMDILSIKNEFMELVDIILKAQPDLEYEDRVILRAITCLGKQCSADLSHLMNMDTYMIERYVAGLRERKWIKE